MDKNIFLKCVKCNKAYPLTKEVLTCSKHNPYYGYLSVVYDYNSIKINNSKKNDGWSKYLPLLPIKEFKIGFNEQKTPLFKLEKFGKKMGLKNLYVKDEGKNPTGSFKDKESAVTINKALEWGINHIFVVSSGNAAVSTAAYAQKAGIKCDCLVSKNLSAGKRFLITLYGAKIKEIDGNYEAIYRYAIDKNYPGWNCTPGINPLKDEGIKIIGFETWEQIGVPDVIIVPCGNGTLLFGIYKAFKELQILGKIKKLPMFIGVQIKGASPLKVALEENKEFVTLKDIPESIAEGIVAEESYSSPKAMIALKETGGGIIEVTDKEIKQALREIISLESIIPEPTSAAVFAGVKKLNLCDEGKVVCIQTASGVKNLKEIWYTLFEGL
ncbi:threonine synthase [Candidatus Microgenomates bacterium]|nr:threonine synthase [Candidatus Microgenomates bacterium]